MEPIQRTEFDEMSKQIREIHIATVKNSTNSNWFKSIIFIIFSWLMTLTYKILS